MVTFKNKREITSSLIYDHFNGVIAILIIYLKYFSFINYIIFLDLI
jgi:hypothetical protein